MTDRQMFKIINADKNHVLGLCWAESLESAQKKFNKDMGLPPKLITSPKWKEAYDKVINCNITVEKFTKYHFDNEGKVIEIDDNHLNDAHNFEIINNTIHNYQKD